jgi:hypothetical protein
MMDKQKTYMNFGQIKTAYNGVLAESISNGDKKIKSIFKKYVKTLRENEALKAQFFIFNNIENKIEDDKSKAIEFVKENISLIHKFPKKAIIEANKKIVGPIDGGNIFVKFGYSDDELKKLHEDISFLINTEKNGKTVGAIIEATHSVADYIVNNKKVEPIVEGLEDIVISTKELGNLMVNRFNDRYSELTESEREIFKTILESTDETKEELYTNIIKECLELVNDKMKNDNTRGELELYETLLTLKENLLNRKYIKESFESDIIKIIELKNSFN